MQTVEITRADWARRLNEFTAVHDGWLVSVDVLSPETGGQRQIDNLPLLGVSADRINHDGSVAVSVARPGGTHFTHVIREVKRIYIEQTSDGADAGLQIESGDGTKTIMRFRVVALPETVDEFVRR
jgi:hypothetical protein